MLVFTGFPANSLYKGEPMGFNGGLMGIWQSCKQTMGLLWTISKILSDKHPMGPMGLIDDNHGLFVQTIVVCHEITCFKDHCILCTISKLLVPFFSSNTTDWHFLNWHYYLFGPIFLSKPKRGHWFIHSNRQWETQWVNHPKMAIFMGGTRSPNGRFMTARVSHSIRMFGNEKNILGLWLIVSVSIVYQWCNGGSPQGAWAFVVGHVEIICRVNWVELSLL